MTLPPAAGILERIVRALSSAHSVLIAGHRRPDGDCLGSQLALRHALTALGKQAHCYNEGPLPPQYAFLPGLDCFGAAPPQNADATVMLDCSAPGRVSKEFRPAGVTICIDHHATDQSPADAAWIDRTASSTGELVFGLLGALGAPVTPEIATCLYTAILTDTGSFRYSNTSPRALEIAARLLEAGADPAAIATACYESRSPGSLWLEGAVLTSLRYECDGRLVWSEITPAMYDRAGGPENEPESLSSSLRAARGVELAVLFKRGPAGPRVSLRSKARVDVAALAARFGGGGHPRAAGAEFEASDAGAYDRRRDQILQAARQAVSALAPGAAD